MTKTYPRIEKMMAGYINMDACEIAGSSRLTDQIAYYTTRVSPKALRALLVELDHFQRAHADNLTVEFENAFDYGAEIEDAEQFFDVVRRIATSKLEHEATQPPITDDSVVLVLTPTALRSLSDPSIPENFLHRPSSSIVGQLSQLRRDPLAEAMDKLTELRVEAINKLANQYGLSPIERGGHHLVKAGLNSIESALFQLIQDADPAERSTIMYAQILEKLFESRGVDINIKKDSEDENDSGHHKLTF